MSDEIHFASFTLEDMDFFFSIHYAADDVNVRWSCVANSNTFEGPALLINSVVY